MPFIADFHVHSRYSRATSKEADLENFYRWAMCKGLTVVGTGDFTHPGWRKELWEKLEPAEPGLYRLKEEWARPAREGLRFPQDISSPFICLEGDFPQVRFIVTGELSTIYKKGGRVRKVHHLIILPSLEKAEELSRRLEERGGNLQADGRPILGLDSRHLVDLTLEVCPEAIFIPAHIFTPHFSLLGSNSGFDTVEECFEDYTSAIMAVETGLSSDPPMNWRLSMLDRFLLVSNSDAHSPRLLAREANLFAAELSYGGLRKALEKGLEGGFMGTIEFYPEEGKYHYDGHRNCGVCWPPERTRAAGGICPVCGQKLTIGVLHRVEALADRPPGFRPPGAAAFESLVPLPEILAALAGVGVQSKRVWDIYFKLIQKLGPELVILREIPIPLLAETGGKGLAEAISRMRRGLVERQPGFDGQYGRIIILRPEEREVFSGQEGLFPGIEPGFKAPREVALDRAGGTASGEEPRGFREIPEATELPPQALNPQQEEAVSAYPGPVMVIAGPGTGKTFTLVHRLVWLLGEGGVNPETVTAITFTQKAADTIRERLRAFLPRDKADKVHVGTFHQVCWELLARWGLPGFPWGPSPLPAVLDEIEAREVLRELLSQGIGRGLGGARRLQQRLSLLKNQGLEPSSPEIPPELRAIYCAYEERLQEYQAMDYDHLLLWGVKRTRQALEEGREEVLAPFGHLLVDEFQDLTLVQYQLVRLWAGTGKNLFVIGDPHQSIYGFRGASPRFFRQLKEDYPHTRIVWLRQNYRSTEVILKAAQGVIQGQSCFPGAPSPQLLPARKGGSPLFYREVPSPLAEGIGVVKEINRLVGGTDMLAAQGGGTGRSYSFADIAVLARTAKQLEDLEECFLKEGLPYRVVGGASFLEEKRVRQFLAFLRLLRDPRNIFHLKQAVSIIPETFHIDHIAEILAEGETEACSSGLSPAMQKWMEVYYQAKKKKEQGASPGELLDLWREGLGLEPAGGLEKLAQAAASFKDVDSFLQRVHSLQEGDKERAGRGSTPEAVSLMTLHAAKGLEFPVVFIVGVEEGLLPLKLFPHQEVEEGEELRLFYVGLTRARELVYLSACRRRGGPSPFLKLIPGELLKTWSWDIPRERFQQLSLF
ncbi:MAG TPA: hypothetical protein ENM97_07135 [Moorella mulderi]|nr:hypothetical protein [Moorella mulderi]